MLKFFYMLINTEIVIEVDPEGNIYKRDLFWFYVEEQDSNMALILAIDSLLLDKLRLIAGIKISEGIEFTRIKHLIFKNRELNTNDLTNEKLLNMYVLATSPYSAFVTAQQQRKILSITKK